jgi:hypothetical protein
MPSATRLRSVAATAALAALGVLPTLGRFANGLVFDDRFVIGEGTFIFDPANLTRLWELRTMAASRLDAAIGTPPLDTYRPLSILTFFWDAALSGHAPLAYHATNLVLHAAVVAALHRLLLAVVREGAERTVALVTLAFAWAPWPTEAHVWIDGRSDPLAALFLLLATMAQLRARGADRFAWLSGFAVLAALLSKEVAMVAVPVVAMPPISASWRERAPRLTPVVLACVVYAALRGHALHGARLGDPNGTIALLVANTGPAWLDGLAHLVVPMPYHLANLADDYAAVPWSVRVAITIGLGVAIVAAVRVATRRGWIVARWGGLFYLATMLAPIAVTGASWPGFGRFLYVPAIGLSVVVADRLAWLEASDRARTAAIVATVMLALAALGSVRATALFHDDITYFDDARLAHPEQAWTYGFLGLALESAGRCEDALPALQTASTGAPDDSRFLAHLGECLRTTGRIDQARSVAIEGEARFRDTNREAGFLMLHASTLGPPQAALAHELLTRCLELSPERTDCRDALRIVDGD